MIADEPELAPPPRIALAGLFAGPLAALAMGVAGAPEGLSEAGWTTLALLAWMAIWWVSEALPVAVTALLPLVVLPLAGAATPAAAAAPYADPIIFLFIGGFMLAIAVERWNLHARIALSIAGAIGHKPLSLVGAFVLASAALSMWISNTATALMLMPTAIGVARALAGDDATRFRPFAVALALAVAYGASIGGIGTPVGSPTNLVAMAWLEREGLSLAFGEWMLLAAPVMLVMLLAAWLLLGLPLRGAGTAGGEAHAVIARARAALGPMATAERRVLGVFALVALAWMLRPLLAAWPPLAGLGDTGIALAGALLLFVIPAGGTAGRRPLLDWPAAERLPWGVVLLFGGGLSIAAAMGANGVTDWLGAQLAAQSALSAAMAVLLVVVVTIFATELTSNTATLAAMLPVVGALSLAAGLPPLQLAFAASIAASMAFMLPIATPPNAVAYAAGQVPLATMARIGLWLNVVGIGVIWAVSVYLVPLVVG